MKYSVWKRNYKRINFSTNILERFLLSEYDWLMKLARCRRSILSGEVKSLHSGDSLWTSVQKQWPSQRLLLKTGLLGSGSDVQIFQVFAYTMSEISAHSNKLVQKLYSAPILKVLAFFGCAATAFEHAALPPKKDRTKMNSVRQSRTYKNRCCKAATKILVHFQCRQFNHVDMINDRLQRCRNIPPQQQDETSLAGSSNLKSCCLVSGFHLVTSPAP